MSFTFDPRHGLILLETELSGPAGTGIVSLALDTGATSTLVNQNRLMQLGYDPPLTRTVYESSREAELNSSPVSRSRRLSLWDMSDPISQSSATPCRRVRVSTGFLGWISFGITNSRSTSAPAKCA